MSSVTRPNRLYSDKCIYVYVGGHSFTLNEAQIRSEPESIFVGLSPEGYEPNLDADANIFQLIHAHLKGYEIFPLPPQGIPFGGGFPRGTHTTRILPYMSKEATLKNLLRDATDFGLTNLVAKIEQEMAGASKESKTQPTDDESEAAKEFVILD